MPVNFGSGLGYLARKRQEEARKKELRAQRAHAEKMESARTAREFAAPVWREEIARGRLSELPALQEMSLASQREGRAKKHEIRAEKQEGRSAAQAKRVGEDFKIKIQQVYDAENVVRIKRALMAGTDPKNLQLAGGWLGEGRFNNLLMEAKSASLQDHQKKLRNAQIITKDKRFRKRRLDVQYDREKAQREQKYIAQEPQSTTRRGGGTTKTKALHPYWLCTSSAGGKKKCANKKVLLNTATDIEKTAVAKYQRVRMGNAKLQRALAKAEKLSGDKLAKQQETITVLQGQLDLDLNAAEVRSVSDANQRQLNTLRTVASRSGARTWTGSDPQNEDRLRGAALTRALQQAGGAGKVYGKMTNDSARAAIAAHVKSRRAFYFKKVSGKLKDGTTGQVWPPKAIEWSRVESTRLLGKYHIAYRSLGGSMARERR
tara:strand:+ start:13657 stop:14952 length:1296 start_codon:yes stop_codon:yes gene_type:complete